MSVIIDNATIKLRRDTASNWTVADSVLASGEIGFETDTKLFKIGDGVTAWTSLPYPGITPIGGMLPFAGATAPSGWLLCDGSAVSRTTYANLFSAIGETWGAGDSSTTFNVPDLREAAPVGVGTSGETITAHDVYTLGEFKDDQGQDHTHASGFAGDGLTGRYGSQTGLASQSYLDHGATGGGTDGIKSSAPIEEGSSGPPRRGTVTRGKRVGVNYIIKF